MLGSIQNPSRGLSECLGIFKEKMPRQRTPFTVERLKERVELVGTCWIWKGACAGNGYGTVRRNDGTPGIFYVHRLMRALIDEVPHAALDVVRHTCDNPPCCNPDHLVNGSTADNARDAVSKGRHVGAQGKHWKRLSDKDVLAIRQAHVTGQWSQTELAARYNVTPSAISTLVHGRSHKKLL
jgi:hypothetical protein